MSRISLRTIKEEHATLNAILQLLLIKPKQGPLVTYELFFDNWRNLCRLMCLSNRGRCNENPRQIKAMNVANCPP